MFFSKNSFYICLNEKKYKRNQTFKNTQRYGFKFSDYQTTGKT